MNHIPKDQRKRILFITDSLNCTSGVGNISREIVYATANHFNWLVIGGFQSTANHGKIFDLSTNINAERGYTDSHVYEIQYSGYGDKNLYEHIVNNEKIDAIILMSDPRSHLTFFNNINLFNNILICWYNIWDAYPTPHFNKAYYDSCDTLINISKFTDNIVKEILDERVKDKIIKYVPHGFDQNMFFNVGENTPEFAQFCDLTKIDRKKFNILFNSVNIPRKNIPVLLEAYKMFVDANNSEYDKFNLILHTQETSLGGNLVQIMDGLYGKNHKYNVHIIEQRFDTTMMRYLYNACDVLVLPSSQEGFGMSLGEAVMCEKMIIAPLHGGMSDQMDFGKGVWAEPILDFTSVLTSNDVVPYIYSNYIDKKDLFKALSKIYQLPEQERKRRGKIGREFFINNGLTSYNMTENVGQILNESMETFIEKLNYTLTKI
jgi:glycosyltransferase involved in cell wall biosynthesis